MSIQINRKIKTESNLDEIRKKLMNYEDKIIDKYIECTNYKRENTFYINYIIETKNKHINSIYHFVISDLIDKYFSLIIKYNKGLESADCITIDTDIIDIILDRIFIGIDVIKAKMRMDSEKYMKLIRDKDVDNIYELLENKDVENKIIERLKNKKKRGYNDKIRDDIVSLYENYIIPATKKIQIIYCLK